MVRTRAGKRAGDRRSDRPVPVADPEGLASHGGFKDWFIQEMGRPGFTLEMGKGENPLPLSDFEGIYEKAQEMLLLAALM